MVGNFHWHGSGNIKKGKSQTRWENMFIILFLRKWECLKNKNKKEQDHHQRKCYELMIPDLTFPAHERSNVLKNMGMSQTSQTASCQQCIQQVSQHS